jgi:site-specific DNA-methyltransferase (adenine-specific)
MSHFSEASKPLAVECLSAATEAELLNQTQDFADVCVLRLPAHIDQPSHYRLDDVSRLVQQVVDVIPQQTTLVIIGEIIDLVQVHSAINDQMNFHHWIALRRATVQQDVHSRWLPAAHYGALIYTKYNGSLTHIKTRIHYTYCPACDKTTKDYGGKKHTYHEAGTLVSDVWRDIACDLDGDLLPVIERLADLFGVEQYHILRLIDLRKLLCDRRPVVPTSLLWNDVSVLPDHLVNQLIHGDCLTELRKLPDNSIDFVFTDPPYNLKKKYRSYSDDLEISAYFEWCDEWLFELARVLKPGGTCAILNIPLWSIRHFQYLETILKYQGWIAWDALSFPVRLIMPAHYTILCFSKGQSRPLPGLIGESGQTETPFVPAHHESLRPMAEGYCLRSSCIKKRQGLDIDDRGDLTDIWWDIHRLKHNARRVDHPTQLPPFLLYRLISLFTRENEVILDCFNGSGTTTLAAQQLNRRYIGIEKSEKYHQLALQRHQELEWGMNPFRKAKRKLTAKNSRVARMPKQKYEVPKKVLQLEVRRIAQEIGHLPSREEVEQLAGYPIRYYDDYFSSWGEVCAAARHNGMTESKDDDDGGHDSSFIQPNLL